MEYILLSLLIACGVFIKHKDNIKRLFAGTESKVSVKSRKSEIVNREITSWTVLSSMSDSQLPVFDLTIYH